MDKQYEGACLCGEVRFHYRGASLWCGHCHCSMCRRAHGAAVVTWVGVAEETFHLDSAASLRWHASSDPAQRGFCGTCGSTLFFRSTRWPGEMHIALGTMNGEIDRQPAGHVFWESHVSWLSFDDALPKIDSTET